MWGVGAVSGCRVWVCVCALSLSLFLTHRLHELAQKQATRGRWQATTTPSSSLTSTSSRSDRRYTHTQVFDHDKCLSLHLAPRITTSDFDLHALHHKVLLSWFQRHASHSTLLHQNISNLHSASEAFRSSFAAMRVGQTGKELLARVLNADAMRLGLKQVIHCSVIYDMVRRLTESFSEQALEMCALTLDPRP